jgi:phage/conjugal plasmid C-4 type zinc finger TraR family protein
MSDVADDSQFIIDATIDQSRANAENAIKANDATECEECGEPIGEARKNAYPAATLCIDCAEWKERVQKLYGNWNV